MVIIIIMQLLPSVVRGYILSRPVVGRWSHGPPQSWWNHHHDYPSILSRTIRGLSNTPECSVVATDADPPNDKGMALGTIDDDIDHVSSDSSDNLVESPLPPPRRVPVWNHPAVQARVAQKKLDHKLRFRQHVNPLSRLYQQPTILPDQWPTCVYTTVSKRPLHLDIGCGKGGFLIDLCQTERQNQNGDVGYNYLGLEIRPGVALYAKERVAVHALQGQLDFLGCNANVDLERILKLYQSHYRYNDNDETDSATTKTTTEATIKESLCLHRVTIQFPDPHFKTQHLKRRVVTNLLVDTVAKYMPTHGTIILQSDIQAVLDAMRRQFRDANAAGDDAKGSDGNRQATTHYFIDAMDDDTHYIPENCLGVPTEREQSVLNNGLPVFRSLLTRSSCPYRMNTLEDR